ncbi:MAG: RnfABCDGE type electron transport complex subunit A [Oscillospiraceae bacterium]|nr:RnfABCDGE type electron transport complex subunit A [Oscillospiraceae bacterium]
MEFAKDILVVLLTAILAENFILTKFLGICPFLGVSKKLDSAMGMSVAVIFVMIMATAVTFPIYVFLLDPFGLQYLETVVFILVIAALVQLVEMILKKFIPALHRSLGVFLPLITTNCAVLGVTMLDIDNWDPAMSFGASYGNALLYSLGAGLGFTLAMILFAGVRSRLDSDKTPKCFQGMPITLIAAAIVSVAFMGFGGVVDGLFQ